ncbi:MAG TPA: recombinase family protein, partial [Parafilimonas sp.]|nr:recombinase family protein [Parafilimonas sp.]
MSILYSIEQHLFSSSNNKLKHEILKGYAVIYTRVSTKEQAEKNLSLETQLRRCKEHCFQNGYEILECFGGTYESAKTDNRKEFKRVIDFIKKHNKSTNHKKIKFLVVFSLDRFSRSGLESLHVLAELRAIGVRLVSVIQPTDSSTKEGKLSQSLGLLLSEYENEMRAEKCVEGIKQLLLNGNVPGRVPLGYTKVKKGTNGSTTCIINNDGQILRKAFRKKLEGKSNTDIQTWLKLNGLIVYPQKLTKIFKNVFYCGLIRNSLFPNRLLPGTHEKMITEEEYMRICNISSEFLKGANKKEDEDFPLKACIQCDKCGSALTAYPVKGKNAKY